MAGMDGLPGRRPLRIRGSAWARALAGALARRRVPPNAISLASIGCAAGAAVALALWRQAPGTGWQAATLVAAAAGIQLRLLCNMLDGMVAVEGGLRSPVGDLYNEVPDRIADSLILVAAGYGLGLPYAKELGWAAAVLAMLTAYIRALGGGLGVPGCFHGPMAKPQRMALMTAACLAAAAAVAWSGAAWLLWWALAAVAAGSSLTCGRRLGAIARVLRSRPS